MSIARQHFQKHQAQSTAEQAVEYGSMQQLNAYELQLLQLNQDRSRLKNMQSDQLRVEFKKQQISQYLPYIQGILAVKPNVQDDIISEMMVWAIDIGDFDFALELAEYVLSANIKLPDRFGRSEACFITEAISEQVLKQLKTDDFDVHLLLMLQRLEQLINDEKLSVEVRDMPDEAKAKLYLALGRTSLKLQYYQDAKDYLQQAIDLHEHCGGKTDLNNALKQLKLAEQEQEQQTPQQQTDDQQSS